MWQHTHTNNKYQRSRLQSHLPLWQNNDPSIRNSSRNLQRQRLLLNRQMKLPQPCLTCGTLTTNGNRCPIHQQQTNARWAAVRANTKQQTGQYGGSYKRLARIVRMTATHCHICKQPFTPLDTIEADHLYPGTPVTDITQLAPAHQLCNARRGNKPLT